ncbi:hypothetical protein ES708_19678 [subsurface metagenome]
METLANCVSKFAALFTLNAKAAVAIPPNTVIYLPAFLIWSECFSTYPLNLVKDFPIAVEVFSACVCIDLISFRALSLEIAIVPKSLKISIAIYLNHLYLVLSKNGSN